MRRCVGVVVMCVRACVRFVVGVVFDASKRCIRDLFFVTVTVVSLTVVPVTVLSVAAVSVAVVSVAQLP